MARRVQVAGGHRGVALVNGQLVVEAGDEVVVSDAEWATLGPMVAQGVLVDLGDSDDPLTPVPNAKTPQVDFSAIENDIEALQVEVDAVEGVNTTQQGEIDAVETVNTSQQAAIDDHETRLDVLEYVPPMAWGASTSGSIASGNATVTPPAHSSGDLLVMSAFRNDSGGITTPAGWNVLFGGNRIYGYWKVGSGAEPAFTLTIGGYASWICTAVGVSGSSPSVVLLSAAPTAFTATVNDFSGSELVGAFGANYSGSVPSSAPTGWSFRKGEDGSGVGALSRMALISLNATNPAAPMTPPAWAGGDYAIKFGVKQVLP